MYKGGGTPSTNELRDRIRRKKESERIEALRKAERALRVTINKAKKALVATGIQARKDEKIRKAKL